VANGGTTLVTGARGHVGGKLVEALVANDLRVRALTRGEYDGPAHEVAVGDVADTEAMHAALEGIDAAFYLVHALGTNGPFAEEERTGARTFAVAAREQGVRRIVYLGGIVHDDDLSEHLASRREVGEILRASGVPTIEFRASIVVGEGSASFELIRDLLEELPALVVPTWLENGAQPIAVDDLIDYLVAAIDVPLQGSAVYEIGGADRVTYRDLVDEVGRQLGREPAAVVSVAAAVPMRALSLMPEALTGILPERARLAASLIESLRYDTSVREASALHVFDVRPRGLADAVATALGSR
jgi:uncharacterized protein YbjT (DUF2867 family)